MSNLPPPRIVCAAIKFTAKHLDLGGFTTITVIGPRHYDLAMQTQMDCVARLSNDYEKTIKEGEKEQGFIDQRGKFYTREQAWKIAEANGQIIRRCGGDTANGGTLYSENLY